MVPQAHNVVRPDNIIRPDPRLLVTDSKFI